MQRRPRRNHTPAFKAKVALAAIAGERTLAQLVEQFDIHPNQITQWKSQLQEGTAGVFGCAAGVGPPPKKGGISHGRTTAKADDRWQRHRARDSSPRSGR